MNLTNKPFYSSTLTLLRTLCIHHFSTTTTTTTITLPTLVKIPYRYRTQAIKQAQEVLTDYLHSTRALPFTYAEHISKNSTFSLAELMCKVKFSVPHFRKNLERFLLYNPINEFGFFYESIGIEYVKVNGCLKTNVHFFSDDTIVLDAACCLAGFGFPWDKLGRLYVEQDCIFEKKPKFLRGRLNKLIGLGFSNQQVVGICLVFPCLLKGSEVYLSEEYDDLLDDLKRVFVWSDLVSVVGGSVDGWYDVCRKIEVFYGLGVERGNVGELMVENLGILTDYSEKVLLEKVEFFSRLGVAKVDVGLLLLRKPDILSFKIDDRVISVLGFLEYFGLSKEKLEFVAEKYKYLLGRNKMVHLPHVLRAIDLQDWFVERVKSGYHRLLIDYELRNPDDGVDEKYVHSLETAKSLRTYSYLCSKLDVLHEIGFGENSFTAKLLIDAHGSGSDLKERFDFLLSQGIEYSKLCNMINRSPKILNQEVGNLEKKIDFLLKEIGLPLKYLEIFPTYLLYNLDQRIKPRYRFHVWLTQKGMCTRKYTVATIVAVSHKGFLSQLSCIHPSAPQLWLEKYGKKGQIGKLKETA